jgi:hypothetical protein
MKRIYSILLLLVVSVSFGQKSVEWTRQKLFGKVKKYCTYDMEFVEDNGKVQIFGKSKKFGFSFEVCLKETGLIDTIWGKFSNDSVWFYNVKFYNGDSLDSSFTYSSSNVLCQKNYYKYLDYNSKLEISLDTRGKVRNYLCDYDDRGNNTKLSMKYDDTFKLVQEDFYNDDNQLIRTLFYGSFQEASTRSFYEYNSQNQVSKEVHNNSESSNILDLSYQYDEKGNWILMYVYEDKKLTRVIKREIAYY